LPKKILAIIFLQNKFGNPNKVTKHTLSAYYVANIFKEYLMKQKDTYKEIRTIYRENIVARVHIPDLAPDEKERRMRNISKVAGQLLSSQTKK
jgi:hypothetical protein